MKRNKIKPKYLNNINQNKINNNHKTIDKEKNVTTQIGATFKALGLIILMLIYTYIPLIFITFLGINYNSLSYNGKMIYIIICSILFLLFIIFIFRKKLYNDAKKFFNKNFLENLKEPIKCWLIGLGIMYFSNLVIAIITNGGIASNEESVRELIDKFPIYMIFQVVIYAPFTEELIFRKSIKDIFNNKYLYILTSGLIFGGLHVMTSVTTLTDYLYLIPYSALGISFAYVYSKTDNIFSTISIHALHNTLALIIFLVGRNI